MRRIVVELYGPELAGRIGRTGGFRRIRTFEVLQVLRHNPKEFVAVVRISALDPEADPERLFRDDPVHTEVRLLRREEGASIVLLNRSIEGRRPGAPGGPLLGAEITKPGSGYLLPPFRYREGRLTFGFGGTPKQLRALLDRARSRGLRYRILSLKEAEFASSVLSRLTDRQREVLRAAYDAGYYAVPRTASSQAIASRLGLEAATVVEHLRKAEKRLLDAILEG